MNRGSLASRGGVRTPPSSHAYGNPFGHQNSGVSRAVGRGGTGQVQHATTMASHSGSFHSSFNGVHAASSIHTAARPSYSGGAASLGGHQGLGGNLGQAGGAGLTHGAAVANGLGAGRVAQAAWEAARDSRRAERSEGWRERVPPGQAWDIPRACQEVQSAATRPWPGWAAVKWALGHHWAGWAAATWALGQQWAGWAAIQGADWVAADSAAPRWEATAGLAVLTSVEALEATAAWVAWEALVEATWAAWAAATWVAWAAATWAAWAAATWVAAGVAGTAKRGGANPATRSPGPVFDRGS